MLSSELFSFPKLYILISHKLILLLSKYRKDNESDKQITLPNDQKISFVSERRLFFVTNFRPRGLCPVLDHFYLTTVQFRISMNKCIRTERHITLFNLVCNITHAMVQLFLAES